MYFGSVKQSSTYLFTPPRDSCPHHHSVTPAPHPPLTLLPETKKCRAAQAAGGAADPAPAPPLNPAPAPAPALSLGFGPPKCYHETTKCRAAQAAGGAAGPAPAHHQELMMPMSVTMPLSLQPAEGHQELMMPMSLLRVVMWFYGTLVWLQLYNPQGIALVSFVPLSPRVPRTFAGAPVYHMASTQAERIGLVGCGFKGKLVQLLCRDNLDPYMNRSDWCKMMQSNVRRVAAGMAAAVRDKAAKEAEELCASGQCADALVPLQRAITLGHLPSRALKAWLLVHGREGVPKDIKAAAELAYAGTALGCHHCQGVLAHCHHLDLGGIINVCSTDNDAKSLQLARESSAKGSRYGQVTLGVLNHYGIEAILVQDHVQAVALYRLAAAQNLDDAQFELGIMYRNGFGVSQDHAEGLRCHMLAAAQGFSFALLSVGFSYELGEGVSVDLKEAYGWYRRAQAAGNSLGAVKLQQLWRARHLDE